MNKEQLIQYYLEKKWSINKVCRHFHIHQRKFYSLMKQYNLNPRTRGWYTWNEGKKLSKEHKEKIKNSCKGKINLGNKYCIGRMPWNKDKNISLETRQKISSSLKGKYIGPSSTNWKGGVSSLSELIRQSIEYVIWKNNVRKPYKCSKCSATKGIEAHHKISFKILLGQFLKQYSQFSPFEDKETLVRLATTYAPFWNIDNGEALCKKCHTQITTKSKERDIQGRFI